MNRVRAITIISILSYSIILTLCCSCNTIAYDSVEISYLNPIDNIKLAGTITIPKVDKRIPAVLLIQGSGPHDRNEEVYGHKPFETIADYLSSKGIAVLRMDRRGCGKSGGIYSDLDLDNYIQDAIYGVDFLKSYPNIDTNRIGLIGHSLGGLIAALVSGKTNDVAFIISCAGPGIWGKDIVFSQNKLWAELSGAQAKDIENIKTLSYRWYELVTQDYVKQEETDEFTQLYIRLSEYMSDDLRPIFFPGPADKALMYFRSPQYKDALQIDPLTAWKNVRCSVLAINGSKDYQVASKDNLDRIRKGLEEGGNTRFQMVELKNHNHMFQRTENGNPTEVPKLKESFSPIVLDLMVNWIESYDKELRNE